MIFEKANQKAQSQIKTDVYTITGTIANPLMTLEVMEKHSPNERIILFFNVEKAALNLNAHQARYPFTCLDETPLCLQLIKVMNEV